jgi:hypothetical protein
MRTRSPKAGRTLPPVIALIAVLLAFPIFASHGEAAPQPATRSVAIGHQLPDWLSPESAARLAVGIDVLVPSYVPAPFGGEPEVQASDGYYSLYWLIPGAPPTYLRVTGTAGGEIPAYSYYDRNVELMQNDSVMGYPAWHDVTPIYDLVYWQVGNVVYTVESHNMTGDSTMGIANSLMSLVVPEAGGESPEEEPVEGETPTETPSDGIFVSAIGAPETVASGEIASIGVEGSGDVYLVASDGYFLASGETGIVVTGGSAVDWQAPYSDSNLEVTFGAYRLADDSQLAETSTTVHGVAAEAAEDTPADLQCPATASASMEARIALSGSGGIAVSSSTGYWPVETPNLDFQPDMDGGPTISGGLGAGSTITLSWMAPDDVGSATLAATDSTGNEVDSCTIEVVSEGGAGDLGAPASGEGGQAYGDGTGIFEADGEVVAQVIANPIGFAGDASGGPEANGPDYDYIDESADEESDEETAGSTTRTPVASSSRSLSDTSDAKLGPMSGADGMYATTLGTEGGKLESPYGATVIVPKDCFEDQTTVMIKPVDDKAIPETAGISTVPGTAFDVAFGAPDGRAVDDLPTPAHLTIALQSASMSENARIYRIDGNVLTLMPLTDSDAGSVSTEIDGLARYVVGVPQGNTAASTSSINPFLIGGLGLIALASAGLLISRGLSRRKPRMIPARRTNNSRVRYR